MEDEIDLRPYVAALLKYWYVVVLAGVAMATAVFLFTATIPASYAATSLVVVVQPQELVEFDTRFREVTASQPMRAFPQLALSDDVLQQVLAQQSISSIRTTADLQRRLSAEAGDDVSIVRLTAVAAKPEDAALLANLWAESFTQWANGLFNLQNGEQLTYFETQLAQAEADLAAADAALIANVTLDRSQIISNTLAVYNQTQLDLLTRQQTVRSLQQNVTHLQDQLQAGDGVTFADQVTSLALQLQLFAADTAVANLQLDPSSFNEVTVAEQTAVLSQWVTILANQETEIQAELAQLEPSILSLQAEQLTATTQTEQLQRRQLLASETYLALARKVEQERITVQDVNTGVVVASLAAIPLEAESRGRVLFTAVGAFAGIALASTAVLAYAWYRSARTSR